MVRAVRSARWIKSDKQKKRMPAECIKPGDTVPQNILPFI